MSEQNKIDEIKARATETMVQTRDMHWSLNDVLLNDIFWLIGQIERKDEALEFYAEEGNYLEHIIGWGPTIPVVQDGGNRAREAL